MPQTFGGLANWNPHVHALITDTCWDRDGNAVPRKGAKQVIYYGAYSQAWRGRERRQGILPKAPISLEADASEEECTLSSHRRRQLWAVLLKKVWNVDALKCPKCGGKMKVISFIEQPSVIRRILKHLYLWEDPRPPPEPGSIVKMVASFYDVYY